MEIFNYTDHEGDSVSVSNGIIRIENAEVMLSPEAARELADKLLDWADFMDEGPAPIQQHADYLVETGRIYQ